jgi:GNAT superfamily N-acetyltransferase
MLNVTFRSLNPETDFPALAQLYRAVEQAAGMEPSATVESLRLRTWGTRWVAEDAFQPDFFPAAGWMASQSPTRFFVYAVVHPAWRRQSLGRQMLTYVEAQAAAQGAFDMVASAQAIETPAITFITHLGYTLVGHNYSLHLPAEVDPGEPLLPPGYTVRTYAEIPDLTLLAQAHNRCFTDRWGHFENSQQVTPQQLSRWISESPDSFIPEGIFLLFAPNGNLAGLSYGRISEGGQRRAVDSPSCTPEYRHLMLEKPLAQVAVNWLRKKFGSCPLALDCWGEAEENINLYRSIGFILDEKDHNLEFCKVVGSTGS